MSALKIRGTSLAVPIALLRSCARQLETNFGGSPADLVARGVELSAEELWLAAHGRPVVSGQISPDQALMWVRSLLPKAEASKTVRKSDAPRTA